MAARLAGDGARRGEAIKMLNAADFYRRHVVGEGELYVFAKDSTLSHAR